MEMVLLAVVAIVTFVFWRTIVHASQFADKFAMRKMQRLEVEQIAIDVDFYSKTTIDINKAESAVKAKEAILALPL